MKQNLNTNKDLHCLPPLYIDAAIIYLYRTDLHTLVRSIYKNLYNL